MMCEPIAQPCRLTRSQFKVTGLSLEFCVCSVSPLLLGGFSLNFGQMLTSVGQCAEPITQPCRLKVKITVETHEFEPWIWCRLHISFTPGRIFFKRWSNVCLSEMMCRIHNSAMLTQGQGQGSLLALANLRNTSQFLQKVSCNFYYLLPLASWKNSL